MNERNDVMALATFLAGLVIGGLAGVLYAPQSGARTRRQLGNYAEDMKERGREIAEDATDTIQRAMKRGRRLANV